MTLKDHPENTPAGQKDKADAEKATAGQMAEVQAQVDKETEQGFRGAEVDTTPNDNYTVAGVTAGKPTPETDEAQAEKVRKDLRAVERGAAGVAER